MTTRAIHIKCADTLMTALCVILLFLANWQISTAYLPKRIAPLASSLTRVRGIKNPLKPDSLRDNVVVQLITRNPLANILRNAYSFFYQFPRRSLPYDEPFQFFVNNTAEFIAWYQVPHNLPPYGYLGEGFPDDFFSYGLPGNILPLGNWDPWGLTQVNRRVVRKYRESELKHGRIAMLACVGFVMQEFWHPVYGSSIGGMAFTHMQQLRELSTSEGLLSGSPFLSSGIAFSPDYLLLLLFFSGLEIFVFQRNWTRWRRDEFPHQFDHHLGIGELKEDYENGDYGFDPLQLYPPATTAESLADRRWIQEVELSHCRLAMIAIMGMLAQEYLTGISVRESLLDLVSLQGANQDTTATVSIGQDSASTPVGGIAGAVQWLLRQLNRSGAALLDGGVNTALPSSVSP